MITKHRQYLGSVDIWFDYLKANLSLSSFQDVEPMLPPFEDTAIRQMRIFEKHFCKTLPLAKVTSCTPMWRQGERTDKLRTIDDDWRKHPAYGLRVEFYTKDLFDMFRVYGWIGQIAEMYAARKGWICRECVYSEIDTQEESKYSAFHPSLLE